MIRPQRTHKLSLAALGLAVVASTGLAWRADSGGSRAAYEFEARLTASRRKQLVAEYRAVCAASPHEGEYLARVPLEVLTQTLNDSSHPGPMMRMKPVVRDGRVTGIRMHLPSSHPCARLGFQDGDILLAADGEPLDGPKAFSQIYQVLRTTEDIHWLVEREGQRHCLQVNFEN